MSSKMHFEIKLIRTFINPLIINPYNKDHFKPAGHLLFLSFNFDGFVGSGFSYLGQSDLPLLMGPVAKNDRFAS